MKIENLTGLYVAKEVGNDFRILVAADSLNDAIEISKGYFIDAFNTSIENLKISVEEFSDTETNFDCDYVVLRS